MAIGNNSGNRINAPFDAERDPTDENYRIVLCGANAYDKKYYFNKKFDKIPENIKEELHIISVLFTEEIGGIFTVAFTPLGEVRLDTQKEEGDLLYDDIGASLMVKEIFRKKREMIEALSIFYKVTFLHQNPADLLEEDPDEDPDEEDES